MKNNLLFASAILILGWLVPAFGSAATYDVAKGSELTFVAKITGSSFKGETQAITGSVELDDAGTKVVSASISIKADSFKTGMDLRDSHMNKKYIQVKQFPQMIFTMKDGAVSTAPGASSKLVGSLQFHGVENKFEVAAVVKSQSATEIVVTSKFGLDITDFKIPQPKFMVVKMNTDLQLELTLVLRKK